MAARATPDRAEHCWRIAFADAAMLRLMTRKPAAKTRVAVVPAHDHFGAPRLLEHVKHLGLEDRVDSFHTHPSAALRHRKHVDNAHSVVVDEIAQHQPHDLHRHARSPVLEHLQQSEARNVNLLRRVDCRGIRHLPLPLHPQHALEPVHFATRVQRTAVLVAVARGLSNLFQLQSIFTTHRQRLQGVTRAAVSGMGDEAGKGPLNGNGASGGSKSDRTLRKRNAEQRWRMFLSSKGMYVEWEPADKSPAAEKQQPSAPASDTAAGSTGGDEPHAAGAAVDKSARIRIAAAFLADVASAACLVAGAEKVRGLQSRHSQVIRARSEHDSGCTAPDSTKHRGCLYSGGVRGAASPDAMEVSLEVESTACANGHWQGETPQLDEMMATLDADCSDMVAAQNLFLSSRIKRLKRQAQPGCALSHQVAAAHARRDWHSLPDSEKYVWLPLDCAAKLRAEALGQLSKKKAGEGDQVSPQQMYTFPAEGSAAHAAPGDGEDWEAVGESANGRESEDDEFSLAEAEAMLCASLKSRHPSMYKEAIDGARRRGETGDDPQQQGDSPVSTDPQTFPGRNDEWKGFPAAGRAGLSNESAIFFGQRLLTSPGGVARFSKLLRNSGQDTFSQDYVERVRFDLEPSGERPVSTRCSHARTVFNY